MIFCLFRCFFVSLVFLSGLISCSSEKKVVYQPEGFRTEHIALRNSDRSVQFLKDVKSLDLASELTLDPIQQTDPRQLKLSVKSSCQQHSQKGTFTQDYLRQGVDRVPVLSLIPKDLLLSIHDSPSYCDFQVSVTNEKNSVDTTLLSGVRIENLSHFSNWDLPFLQEPAVFELIMNQIFAAKDRQTLILQCEEFRTTGVVSGPSSSFHLVFYDQIKRLENIRRPNQKCRLAAVGEFVDRLTPIFTLLLPVRELQISTELLRGELPNAMNGQRPIARIKVLNPNTFTTRLKVTGLDQSVFTYRAIFSGLHGVAPNTESQHPMSWTMSKPEWLEKSPVNEWHLMIPPRGYVEFTHLAEIHRNCVGKLSASVDAIGKHLPEGNRIAFYYVGMNFNVMMATRFWFGPYNNDYDKPLNVSLDEFQVKTASDLPYWELMPEKVNEVFGKKTGKHVIPAGLDTAAKTIQNVNWSARLNECR